MGSDHEATAVAVSAVAGRQTAVAALIVRPRSATFGHSCLKKLASPMTGLKCTADVARRHIRNEKIYSAGARRSVIIAALRSQRRQRGASQTQNSVKTVKTGRLLIRPIFERLLSCYSTTAVEDPQRQVRVVGLNRSRGRGLRSGVGGE